VVCTAQDQCHVAGTCDPLTGTCSNPARPNGAACDDGDRCSRSDTCRAGVCTGGNPVACAAPDQCHAAGACDPATGGCSSPARPDGAPCSDGDACTEGDACRAGVCAGVEIACDDGDPCTDGRCKAGACVQEHNTAACDDEDPCTAPDECRQGRCLGTFGLGADIVCGSQRLLVAPCGAEPLPEPLRKFIEGKMNSTRKLLQKADATPGDKEAKIAKLRAKAVKVLGKISKKVARAVGAARPDQRISETCGTEIDALLRQRQQLISEFVFSAQRTLQ
jgi:hypothetical protein